MDPTPHRDDPGPPPGARTHAHTHAPTHSHALTPSFPTPPHLSLRPSGPFPAPCGTGLRARLQPRRRRRRRRRQPRHWRRLGPRVNEPRGSGAHPNPRSASSAAASSFPSSRLHSPSLPPRRRAVPAQGSARSSAATAAGAGRDAGPSWGARGLPAPGSSSGGGGCRCRCCCCSGSGSGRTNRAAVAAAARAGPCRLSHCAAMARAPLPPEPPPLRAPEPPASPL